MTLEGHAEELKRLIDGEHETELLQEQMEAIIGKLPNPNRLARMLSKNGSVSSTKVIMLLAWAFGFSAYVVGSLFAGWVVPVIGATIPAFDAASFLAVTGAASTLYYSNHNISVGKNSGNGNA